MQVQNIELFIYKPSLVVLSGKIKVEHNVVYFIGVLNSNLLEPRIILIYQNTELHSE